MIAVLKSRSISRAVLAACAVVGLGTAVQAAPAQGVEPYYVVVKRALHDKTADTSTSFQRLRLVVPARAGKSEARPVAVSPIPGNGMASKRPKFAWPYTYRTISR